MSREELLHDGYPDGDPQVRDTVSCIRLSALYCLKAVRMRILSGIIGVIHGVINQPNRNTLMFQEMSQNLLYRNILINVQKSLLSR